VISFVNMPRSSGSGTGVARPYTNVVAETCLRSVAAKAFKSGNGDYRMLTMAVAGLDCIPIGKRLDGGHFTAAEPCATPVRAIVWPMTAWKWSGASPSTIRFSQFGAQL